LSRYLGTVKVKAKPRKKKRGGKTPIERTGRRRRSTRHAGVKTARTEPGRETRMEEGGGKHRKSLNGKKRGRGGDGEKKGSRMGNQS